MKNIIITGGELFNKGAQAMTFVAVNEIRKRFPNHKIYLLSEMDLDRPACERENYNFDFTGWYPVKFAKSQHNPLLRLVCKLRNGNELADAEIVYRNCDMLIDISGYALGSNWDASNNNRYLNHLEFAHAFGIPVYLMSQSFGPFDFGPEHPGIDKRCRRLLPACKAILAREKEGYDALVNTYGLTNVRLAPDLVLNNTGISLKNIFKEIPECNLPEIAPESIAIIPNGRNLSVGNSEEVLKLYETAVHKGLEQGKNVYLLHHATSDATICEMLKERFEGNEKVVLLSQEFSCLEFNELVKGFDYLVASRFHSIVHAYKNGIPCVILGWAKKYEDLSLQFGQDEYLLDVRESVGASDLCAVMDRMNLDKELESQKIKASLADVQKENVFDILNEK